MNILTDANIKIESTQYTDGSGTDIRRTIIGTMPAVVLALVATMQLEPDFARAVESAIRVFKDPHTPNMKSTRPGKSPR